jgi:small conductance mechanosensitive channel
VDLIVRPWCNASDYWGVRSDVTRRMKEELEAAGCSIPYPQRDVHVVPPAV